MPLADPYMKLSNTALGTFSFTHNPLRFNTPHKPRTVYLDHSYSLAQVTDFRFPTVQAGLIGLEVELSWEIMSISFYNSLRSFYESDDMADLITFDARDRAHTPGALYGVRISYFEPDGGHHRLQSFVRNVMMRLNIRTVS
jgi:hypothetical protein